jgi:hypothetical protein
MLITFPLESSSEKITVEIASSIVMFSTMFLPSGIKGMTPLREEEG